MVSVTMSLTPSKVIEREACLWTISPFRLSKDPGPKRCINTWKKEKPKEIKKLYENEKWRCALKKNTMGVAQNNELEFQRLFERHPF